MRCLAPTSGVREEDIHLRTPESQGRLRGRTHPWPLREQRRLTHLSCSLRQPLPLQLETRFKLLLPSLFRQMCILIGRS